MRLTVSFGLWPLARLAGHQPPTAYSFPDTGWIVTTSGVPREPEKGSGSAGFVWLRSTVPDAVSAPPPTQTPPSTPDLGARATPLSAYTAAPCSDLLAYS